MRMNAEKYNVDSQRIALWGDSSGGPTDISKMNYVLSSQNHIEPDSPEGYLIGRKNVLENLDLVAPTIPMNYLCADKEVEMYKLEGATHGAGGFNSEEAVKMILY